MFAVELNFAPARFMRRWKYSVYQSQRAVPARDLKDVSNRVREVIEPALNRRRRIFVPVPYRPVNDQRLADNIFPRHESPIAAVLAVIAVIAQNEIMPLRNNQLAVFHQFPHLQPPFAFQAEGWDVGSGKIIAEHIIGRFQKSHVGLIQRLAVDPDLLVHHPQVVPRYPDHAFDKVLLRIHGIVKHDDVAALDLLIGHEAITQAMPAVNKLVHQQVIADQQRVLHGLGWNLERLHNKSDHEYGDHDRAQQRLRRADHVGAKGRYDPRMRRGDHRNLWRGDG